MGLTSILNALPLPQTVLFKCSTAMKGSEAQYSCDNKISCLTHTDPNFRHLTLTEICYVITGGYMDF